MNIERDSIRAKEESHIANMDFNGADPNVPIVIGEELNIADLIDEPATDRTPFTELSSEELHQAKGSYKAGAVELPAGFSIIDTQDESTFSLDSDVLTPSELQDFE